jgi:F-type H+-transporting ATPase subunit b
MRIRKLLAASALAVGAVIFVGGVAHAQTPTTEAPSATSKVKDEFAQECIDKLEAGGSIDDCQKAPSPIVPETNEIIWGSLSFVVLFLLMWKFAYPGIKNAMAARTERIRDDLDQADQAKADADGVLAQYKAQLADAKNESARIIEEARQQADAVKKEQEARLQTELAEMRARAAADVESAKAQAMADLQGDVAKLAIGAAEVVVQKNLDAATQGQLVENYINQLASRAN